MALYPTAVATGIHVQIKEHVDNVRLAFNVDFPRGVSLIDIKSLWIHFHSGSKIVSILSGQPISRRTVLTGVIASWALFPHLAVSAQTSGRPPTVDLGSGLEIRDYRLFPTEDAMRFIVEIHNTTDSAVDTPAVGVVLPNADEDINYAWATPVSAVLHPHTSGCLIGIAPMAVNTDEDWVEPEWMLCSEISMENADKLSNSRVTVEHSLEFPGPDHARTIINLSQFDGDIRASLLQIHGIVRDANNRLCGQAVPANLTQLETKTSVELIINIVPGLTYIANPFPLLDSVEDIDVSFTVQPRGQAINSGCAPALPWNQ